MRQGRNVRLNMLSDRRVHEDPFGMNTRPVQKKKTATDRKKLKTSIKKTSRATTKEMVRQLVINITKKCAAINLKKQAFKLEKKEKVYFCYLRISFVVEKLL